ncbi:MAG TPA: hypothetical protein VJL59_22660 [Anaerolineales bacterium]|nr:hypothetical protein [Anaerolineales bacterium]
MTEDRRADDPRINTLVADVAVLKEQMAENTKVTCQVRDILASFRIVGSVAKWTAAVGAGATALWHGVDFLRRH